MNAPVAEPFAGALALRVAWRPGRLRDPRSSEADCVYPVRHAEEPGGTSRLTSRDVPMSRIGVLQGTYLGIYINPVCEFWALGAQLPFLHDRPERRRRGGAAKTVEDVVETCWAAKEESGVTFVHLNGGFQGGHALEFAEPFVQR